jgi:hypothetical protein
VAAQRQAQPTPRALRRTGAGRNGKS